MEDNKKKGAVGKLFPAVNLAFDPNNPYLIKGWLGKGQISMVYGPSNVGKSFFVIDLVHTITTGRSWNGFRVTKGKALYIATEGHSGFAGRLEALKKAKAFPKDFREEDWLVLPAKIDLHSSEATDLLCEYIGDQTFDLIVIDTLAMALGAGNENEGVTINAFFSNLHKLRKNRSTHILLVHHTGKEQERGARGHSSLQAAVDTELRLKRNDGLIEVTATKQRDYDTSSSVSFYLEPVVLCKDAEGDEVTSCVVRYAANTGEKPNARGERQTIAIECLKRAIELQGVVLETNGRRACLKKYWQAQTLSEEEFCPDQKDESRQKAFRIAVDDLVRNRLVAYDDKFFWPLEKITADAEDD